MNKFSISINFFKNITKDLYFTFPIDNCFSLFNSINDIPYLIYSTKKRSIIAFDILNLSKLAYKGKKDK